ncbi:hypothetical protein CHCC5027_0208 [Bacillus paralicheniformis]|nr:hypothetical protein CHCC5027_0208 [Bacillus paralicheniformis]
MKTAGRLYTSLPVFECDLFYIKPYENQDINTGCQHIPNHNHLPGHFHSFFWKHSIA